MNFINMNSYSSFMELINFILIIFYNLFQSLISLFSLRYIREKIILKLNLLIEIESHLIIYSFTYSFIFSHN